MNTETKRHIDAARQVLVGVVPNPTSQIDQITNALIYKFMDDMDQAAIKAGGSPSFFINDLEQYAWTRLMDPRKGNQDRMNLYQEALIKFSESPSMPPLFREIFKSAFLPYRSPEVLGLFLKEIGYFDYSHPEELGNAYEYLLSIMSSQGDAGQFRTPRHIIDFIVDVVNPTKDDKVLDPACGTGGFLVKAFQHITEKHDGKDDPDHKEKPLTPDERKSLMGNFEGYDIDPGMVRIAQVNMYLHGFKNPRIFNYDTLSSEDRWNDKFDVILANPPFMSPKGGIVPHKKFGVQSSRSEVLFVDYIMSHLRPKGRAGIVVPEGIIFQSGTVYKQLRKNLIEDGLFCVVSLPSGVFNPYAGVKTSILLFNNDVTKRRDDILFVKIENDGFDLGAQRRPNNKSDIPEAIKVINSFCSYESVGASKIAHTIPKSKIAANGDYNLSSDRYRVATDYTNVRWPMVELGKICDLESGSRQKGGAVESGVCSIGGEQISEDNAIRFEKMKYITEDHFSEMRKGILSKGDVLMVKDGATTGKMGFWNNDIRAAVNEHVFIFRAKDQILPKYVYNVLLSDFFQHELKPYIKGIIGGISLEIQKIKIPLPPLEVQKQIVAELDGYENIITGAKQINKNWKPKIEIDPEWERVKLGEVCGTNSGGTPSKSNPEFWEGSIPWVSSKDMKVDFIDDTVDHISEAAVDKSATKLVSQNTLLGVVRSGILQHTFPVAITTRPMCHNQDILSFNPDESKLDTHYLFYTFKAENKQILRDGIKPGVTVQSFFSGFFKEYQIYLPPLEIQKQIVEKIEAERALVDSAKKLIEIYEGKTKEAIAKIWNDC